MKNEQLYLEILNNLSDGVYFVDLERRFIFWNRAAEEITGYKAEEVLGTKCQDNLLQHIDAEGRPLCIVGCPLYASLIDEKPRKAEVFLRHREGHRIPVLVNIFPLKEDGEVIGAVEVFTANSPVVYEGNLIAQLSDKAMTDALTGLPNRGYLESFLEYRLAEFQRFGRPSAVMFMDIDNFSVFNNSYGHEVGDDVLCAVAESIKLNMRKNDLFGRWGGEEFVGVFSIRQPYDATILAEKMRVLVAGTSIGSKDNPLSVTASFGITMMQEGDSISSVVERADKLMYQSKKLGKNRVSADVE